MSSAPSWTVWQQAPVDAVDLLKCHIYATTQSFGQEFPRPYNADVATPEPPTDYVGDFVFLWTGTNAADFWFASKNADYAPLTSTAQAEAFRATIAFKSVYRYSQRRQTFQLTGLETRRLFFAIIGKLFGENLTDPELLALISAEIDRRLDNNLSA